MRKQGKAIFKRLKSALESALCCSQEEKHPQEDKNVSKYLLTNNDRTTLFTLRCHGFAVSGQEREWSFLEKLVK